MYIYTISSIITQNNKLLKSFRKNSCKIFFFYAVLTTSAQSNYAK